MDNMINWLQTISVGLSDDKTVIRIEFKSSTDNPVTGETNSSHAIYVPTENYYSILDILLKAGKHIEKESDLDLHLDKVGD